MHIVMQAAMLIQKINITDRLCVLERGEWGCVDAWMRARVCACACVRVCVSARTRALANITPAHTAVCTYTLKNYSSFNGA